MQKLRATNEREANQLPEVFLRSERQESLAQLPVQGDLLRTSLCQTCISIARSTCGSSCLNCRSASSPGGRKETLVVVRVRL